MHLLPERISEFFDIVESLNLQYRVGGSFASSAWGMPRQTHDLDVALLLPEDQAESLILATQTSFMISRTDVEEAVTSRAPFRSFQLIHFDEVFKIDVFVVSNDEYQQEAFSKTRDYALFPKRNLKFSSPEDTVISKLRWFELGNRISDKQWNDIVQVLEMQQGQLDLDYLAKWATHFGVHELLAKAQSQVVQC